MKLSELGPAYASFVFTELIKGTCRGFTEMDNLPASQQRERRDIYLRAHLMSWSVAAIGMQSRPGHKATAHCVADNLFYTVCDDPDFDHWTEPELRNELGICMQELSAIGGLDINKLIPALGLWVAHKTKAENSKEKNDDLMQTWTEFCYKCVELVSMLQKDFKIVEDIKY